MAQHRRWIPVRRPGAQRRSAALTGPAPPRCVTEQLLNPRVSATHDARRAVHVRRTSRRTPLCPCPLSTYQELRPVRIVPATSGWDSQAHTGWQGRNPSPGSRTPPGDGPTREELRPRRSCSSPYWDPSTGRPRSDQLGQTVAEHHDPTRSGSSANTSSGWVREWAESLGCGSVASLAVVRFRLATQASTAAESGGGLVGGTRTWAWLAILAGTAPKRRRQPAPCRRPVPSFRARKAAEFIGRFDRPRGLAARSGTR
jgi:hypothetical protein